MKIACNKCKKILTEDLYKVSVKWGAGLFGGKVILNEKQVYDIYNYDGFTEGKVKKGLFYEIPAYQAVNNKYAEDCPAQILRATPKILSVGENSILDGVIPEFISGYGCCNYSMGEPLNCSCGHTVGNMFLDCYETGRVGFVQKNI